MCVETLVLIGTCMYVDERICISGMSLPTHTLSDDGHSSQVNLLIGTSQEWGQRFVMRAWCL
jgi:hypothetical protein